MLRSIMPVLRLIELSFWRFLTLNIHPLAPIMARAVVRINELENA